MSNSYKSYSTTTAKIKAKERHEFRRDWIEKKEIADRKACLKRNLYEELMEGIEALKDRRMRDAP